MGTRLQTAGNTLQMAAPVGAKSVARYSLLVTRYFPCPAIGTIKKGGTEPPFLG